MLPKKARENRFFSRGAERRPNWLGRAPDACEGRAFVLYLTAEAE